LLPARLRPPSACHRPLGCHTSGHSPSPRCPSSTTASSSFCSRLSDMGVDYICYCLVDSALVRDRRHRWLVSVPARLAANVSASHRYTARRGYDRLASPTIRMKGQLCATAGSMANTGLRAIPGGGGACCIGNSLSQIVSTLNVDHCGKLHITATLGCWRSWLLCSVEPYVRGVGRVS
jgi:hypothetical protein